jgi:hypothetical protein
MRRSWLALVVSAVCLVGCGGAKAGAACDTTGFVCGDASTALECQSNVWLALPCRGPAGCKKATDTITCDMSLNLENDACATTAVGKGLCTTDGKATLECRVVTAGGVATAKLQKTNDCRTCAVQGEQVVCQP